MPSEGPEAVAVSGSPGSCWFYFLQTRRSLEQRANPPSCSDRTGGWWNTSLCLGDADWLSNCGMVRADQRKQFNRRSNPARPALSQSVWPPPPVRVSPQLKNYISLLTSSSPQTSQSISAKYRTFKTFTPLIGLLVEYNIIELTLRQDFIN